MSDKRKNTTSENKSASDDNKSASLTKECKRLRRRVSDWDHATVACTTTIISTTTTTTSASPKSAGTDDDDDSLDLSRTAGSAAKERDEESESESDTSSSNEEVGSDTRASPVTNDDDADPDSKSGEVTSTEVTRAPNNSVVNSLSNEEIDRLMKELFCGVEVEKDVTHSERWAYGKFQNAQKKRANQGKKGPPNWGDFMNAMASNQRPKTGTPQHRTMSEFYSKMNEPGYRVPDKALSTPLIYEWQGHYWYNRSETVVAHATKKRTESDQALGRNSSEGYPRIYTSLKKMVGIHTVIWRWANGYEVIPDGQEVSHLTDQRGLMDPGMFVAESGLANRARSLCRSTQGYAHSHPRSKCQGGLLSGCQHQPQCVDRCMHDTRCCEPFTEPPTVPTLYEASTKLQHPFKTLAELRQKFPARQ